MALLIRALAFVFFASLLASVHAFPTNATKAAMRPLEVPITELRCFGKSPLVDLNGPYLGGNITHITNGKYPPDLFITMDRRIVKNSYTIHLDFGQEAKASDSDYRRHFTQICDLLAKHNYPNMQGQISGGRKTGRTQFQYDAKVDNFMISRISSLSSVKMIMPQTEKV